MQLRGDLRPAASGIVQLKNFTLPEGQLRSRFMNAPAVQTFKKRPRRTVVEACFACLRGGTYAGAVKVDGVTYGVPKMTTNTQGVLVVKKTLSAGASLNVPLQIAHAGGSNMPVAVLVQTE